MTVPPLPVGEPAPTLADPHGLLEGYLDYYRGTLLRKAAGLPEEELRAARLPSGWTPLELIRHLQHVEQRWLNWGFMAESVPRPWGDHGTGEAADRWQVPEGTSTQEVLDAYSAQCDRSRQITAGGRLDRRAATGGCFPTEAEAPTLAWILFHLLQEYARHVGQLDVVVELAGGGTGE
ncbi:DinB family protein [Streptomyces qinglanensis]|uniref:DinB family protein n=1 Tax=Streptomyces qinglanensis TaxID=943816 RepID=UPI003D748A65